MIFGGVSGRWSRKGNNILHREWLLLGLCMLAAGSPLASAAGGLPIIGGATYDPVTRTGFIGFAGEGGVADTSTGAIGMFNAMLRVNGVDKGSRSFRFDETGSVQQMDDLGVDPANGHTTVGVAGLNASGIGVGSAYVFDDPVRALAQPATWDRSGHITELPLPVSTSGTCTAGTVQAMNGTGISVGAAFLKTAATNSIELPARWSADGTSATLLGTLSTRSSNPNTIARAINDSGVAVGSGSKFNSSGKSLGTRAIRWDANSLTAIELGNLGTDSSGSTNVVAFAINNAGTVIGSATRYSTYGGSLGERAVRWDPNSVVPTELGTLGTYASAGTTTTTTIAINDAGVIIGTAAKYIDSSTFVGSRAVRWDTSGNPTELRPLSTDDAGIATSMPFAINDLGMSVGNTCAGTTGVVHAVVWDPDGSPTDLNTLVPSGSGWINLGVATALTSAGWVTGTGVFDPDGPDGPSSAYSRNFLMLVPQAGTYGQGDANFDTHVDFADLLILAKHYGQSSNGATDAGDFDLNGVTDFSDLLTLAKHYGTSPSSVLSATGDAAFADDWALAQSLVPEPTAAAALLLPVASIGTRRRAR